jgi:hypothetical protein
MPEHHTDARDAFEFNTIRGYFRQALLLFIGGMMSTTTFLIVNWAMSPSREEIRAMNEKTVENILKIVNGMVLTEDNVIAIMTKHEALIRVGDRITWLLDADKSLMEADNQIRQRLEALEQVDHARDIELEKIKADIRFLENAKKEDSDRPDP